MSGGATHHRMKLANILHQRRQDQDKKSDDSLLHHCDCVLVCQDGHLVCHSAMLAAASSLWTKIIPSVQTQLGLEQLVILLPDFSTSEMESMLEILYSGETIPESTRDLENNVILAKQMFPGLELTVDTCNNLGDAAVVEQKTVVTIEEVNEEQSEHSLALVPGNALEGYHKSDLNDSIIKWEKNDSFEENMYNDMNESATEEGPVINNIGKVDKVSPLKVVGMTVNKNVRAKSQNDNKCCKECGKTFLYPKDLKKHQLVHLKVLPYYCKLCSKGVRTMSNMYKHLRQKHDLVDDLKSFILDDKGNQFVELKDVIKKNVAEGRIDPDLLIPEKIMEMGSVGQNKNGVNLYKCLICDKHVTKYSLKNHLNVHNGDDCFKCDLCSKSYFTNSALSNHKITNHQDQKPENFKCSTCYRSFRSILVRDHHSKNCAVSDPTKRNTVFECRICNKIFGYKNNLVSHQKAFHGFIGKKILDYPCKHCGEMIKGKLKLSKHIIAAHPEANGELCDLCGKSFKTEIKLLRHISVHRTRERNLHCSFCPKKFFRKDVLAVHEKVHTNPVFCKECGKKFPEERYLNAHMVLHSEKKYKCKVCSKSFVSELLLNNHRKDHENEKTYHCSFCLKCFKTKTDLTKHTQEHSNEFPLHCDICNKGFLLDSQLEKHIDIVHTKATKSMFTCQHCPQADQEAEFSTIYSLRRHLGKHKCPIVTIDDAAGCSLCELNQETCYKLKNYIKQNQSKKVLPCQECDKKFKTVQELRVHSVVHSRIKPYSCGLCGEKFTQSSSLKTHYARHKTGTVGSEYYCCSDCGKICKTFAALKSHSKSHHHGFNSSASTLAQEQTGTFPQLFLQPDLLGLEQLSQFQVTTINIEGLEDAASGTSHEVEATGGLVALEQGVATLVGEAGEFKIQIIDDLSSIG